jgi:hypothetical protein
MGPLTRFKGAFPRNRARSRTRPPAAEPRRGIELTPVPDLLGALSGAQALGAAHSLGRQAESPADDAQAPAPDLSRRLDEARNRLRATIPPPDAV